MLKCKPNCSLHLLPFIALIALMSGNDTNTASSSGVAKPSGCTDGGILKSTACHSVPLALCFYNLGLLCNQVKTKQKYRKLIFGNLHRDFQRMIEEYDMDVILKNMTWMSYVSASWARSVATWKTLCVSGCIFPVVLQNPLE